MSIKFKAIINTLNEILNDTGVPQNIRQSSENLIKSLHNNADTIEIRKNRAIQLIEEMTADANLDMATRTTLYHTLSLVESLNESDK